MQWWRNVSLKKLNTFYVRSVITSCLIMCPVLYLHGVRGVSLWLNVILMNYFVTCYHIINKSDFYIWYSKENKFFNVCINFCPWNAVFFFFEHVFQIDTFPSLLLLRSNRSLEWYIGDRTSQYKISKKKIEVSVYLSRSSGPFLLLVSLDRTNSGTFLYQ